MLRARESETKKTLELDLTLARTERDALAKAQRETELKQRDLEAQRLKLDKEHVESIERYKSELQRAFADQDFDLHRRRLQVEEEEHRVKLERDRFAKLESGSVQSQKELASAREELARLGTENTALFKENRDMRDQLRVLNDNLRRETE